MTQEALAGLSIDERKSMWRGVLARPDPQAKLVLAVQSDGEIVGFARGGPIRNKGADFLSADAAIFAIYLLDKAKRQGLGRKMMRAVFEHLAAQGFRSVGLWVLKENLAARRFYETLGGQAGLEQTFDVRGQMLTEVAYRFELLPKL